MHLLLETHCHKLKVSQQGCSRNIQCPEKTKQSRRYQSYSSEIKFVKPCRVEYLRVPLSAIPWAGLENPCIFVSENLATMMSLKTQKKSATSSLSFLTQETLDSPPYREKGATLGHTLVICRVSNKLSDSQTFLVILAAGAYCVITLMF